LRTVRVTSAQQCVICQLVAPQLHACSTSCRTGSSSSNRSRRIPSPARWRNRAFLQLVVQWCSRSSVWSTVAASSSSSRRQAHPQLVPVDHFCWRAFVQPSSAASAQQRVSLSASCPAAVLHWQLQQQQQEARASLSQRQWPSRRAFAQPSTVAASQQRAFVG
jgi:hypothetical protein